MRTIKEVEAQAEGSEKLREVLEELGLFQDGYALSIRLRGKSRDKRRTADFEKNWSADSDSICIGFRPDTEKPQANPRPVATRPPEAPISRRPQSGSVTSDPLSDLIRALNRAESRPGYQFVALKWFRDTALLEEGFSWANDYATRKVILGEAIQKRLILTSRMPNPKSPQFPVTAIRLNRLMPEVAAILGNRNEGPGFQPIPIGGERLSSTVMRDRR